MRVLKRSSSVFAILAGLLVPLLGVDNTSASIAIATVPVGNPGNSADPSTGFGTVAYSYNIGEYDVTANKYTAFLNAVAATDPYAVYDPSTPATNGMDLTTKGNPGIVRSGSPGDYSYSVIAGRGNYPVTDVTFLDAARFANWLDNGQPTGAEGTGTTETGAYTISPGTSIVSRNAGVAWAVANNNEWYKAAYYNPASNTYSLYATQSNTISPTQANYNANGSTDTTPVGSYPYPSYYGTYDQAGNADERIEGGTNAELRGGSYQSSAFFLQSNSNDDFDNAANGYHDTGFRVSLAYEPAWNVNAGGNWNVAGNWTTNYVPNGAGNEADFGSIITSNATVFTDLPITIGTIKFTNTASSASSYIISGGGTLTLDGTGSSSGSALVEVANGTQVISMPLGLTLASNTVFQTDATTAELLISCPMTVDAGVTLTTTGTGSVVYNSTITLQNSSSMSIASSTYAHALSLGASSIVTLPTSTGSATVLQLDSLTNTGGTVNLNNNDLIVHGGSLTAVTSELASGYHNGTWTGAGISSGSASTDTSHLHALGVSAATAAGTFEGVPVAGGDVLVKYTYYGDTNLDGLVDGSDYSRIDNAYLSDQVHPQEYTGWSNGDFNYDGVIDGSDYTLIDNAFNSQGTQIASQIALPTAQVAGVSAVPEPTAIALLAVGAVGLLGRRRR